MTRMKMKRMASIKPRPRTARSLQSFNNSSLGLQRMVVLSARVLEILRSTSASKLPRRLTRRLDASRRLVNSKKISTCLATSRLPIPMRRIRINNATIYNRLGPLWREQMKLTNIKICRRNLPRQLDLMRSLTSCKIFKRIRKSSMLSPRSRDKRLFTPSTSIPSWFTTNFSLNLASPTSRFTIFPLKSKSRWNGRATFIFALTTP